MKNWSLFFITRVIMFFGIMQVSQASNQSLKAEGIVAECKIPSKLQSPQSLGVFAAQAPSVDTLLNSFLSPVKFSQDGLKDFFIHTFNQSLYTERFLPSCFIHVIDFMDYGALQQKPYVFYTSIFDVFLQKIKGSSWVNPYALLSLLDRLPEYLDGIVDDYDNELRTNLREELENVLIEKFAMLKSDPDTFLDEAATLLTKKVHQSESASSIKNFQNSLVRFLENSLSKIVWNPYDALGVWSSLKLLAKKIMLFHRLGIIYDQNDVNQLLWSLLYRFGYFIENAGSYMSSEFYATVLAELDTDAVDFLQSEELDQWITTKKEYCAGITLQGHIKAQAREKGFFVETIV